MLNAIMLTDKQIKKYGYMFENIEENMGVINFSDQGIEKACDDLRKTSATKFKVDNGGFTANVTRKKDTLVFFSVPYDKGWSATVNGKPCEIEKVNAGFMAVKVEKGKSVMFRWNILKLIILLICGQIKKITKPRKSILNFLLKRVF